MKRMLFGACLVMTACAPGSPGPSTIRLGEDACAHCRMTIVGLETAAQIVSPGAEPIMFDEIGCLRDYLAGGALAADATIFVVDHRSGAWIDARSAVFTKTTMRTPMSSGLLAHADSASRDADPFAQGGLLVAAADVLAPPAVSARP
jgi:copper chaperone NosL